LARILFLNIKVAQVKQQRGLAAASVAHQIDASAFADALEHITQLAFAPLEIGGVLNRPSKDVRIV
jgi:hypothetical protein